MKHLSRRELITRAGKFATGLTVASAAGLKLFSAPEARSATPPYPWPYVKLDPEDSARRAYDGYYKGQCCYGVGISIIEPLQEKVGEPYTVLPLDIFRFGYSGVVGWGTICGALLGAGMAAAFAAGRQGDEILNELMHWYTVSPLPIYKPKNPKAEPDKVTVSGSPLCHISTGRWMKEGETLLNDPRRRERCARLSADVARQAVLMLNSWKDGSFTAKQGAMAKMLGIPAQSNCIDCHSDRVPSLPSSKK
jgi:hypothetical protein